MEGQVVRPNRGDRYVMGGVSKGPAPPSPLWRRKWLRLNISPTGGDAVIRGITTPMWTYYGLDWIAMGLTFWSIYWIGERRRMGFVLGMIGNGFWFVFGYFAASPATLVANVVIFLLNLRGYLKWAD